MLRENHQIMKSLVLFLLFFISTSALTSYTNVPYSDHCSSIVPESHLTVGINKTIIPDLESQYVVGGNDLLVDAPPNISHIYKLATLHLNPTVYETVDAGVYKVDGTFKMFYTYLSLVSSPDRMSGTRTVTFRLHGFWSEVSKKLCMVGLASQCVFAGDRPVTSNVGLKISFISDDSPTIHASVIKGTLESTGSSNDSGYFKFNQVSIFSFPAVEDYTYSLVSEELGDFADNIGVSMNEFLALDPEMFSEIITSTGNTGFVLDFTAGCKAGKRCSPLGVDHEFLPNYVSLHPLQFTTSGERKIRYLIKFASTTYSPLSQRSFELNSMFIGEGWWDDKNNRVLVVGCRLLNQAYDSKNSVGDCPLRLSLRYRSTWTIRNREKIVGRIWTNESVDSPRYFEPVEIIDIENDMAEIHDLRYDYTELDRVRELCITREFVKENQVKYPDSHYCHMTFDMLIMNSSKGKHVASGYARPISVENHVCKRYDDFEAGFPGILESKEKSSTMIHVGYKIGISYFELKEFDTQFSASPRGYVAINAEGVYNSETGQLCMVGCRELINRTLDCDILVNIEFGPLDESTEEANIISKGTIRSTRKIDDALRFEELSITSADFYDGTFEDGLGEHYGLAPEESEVSATISSQ